MERLRIGLVALIMTVGLGHSHASELVQIDFDTYDLRRNVTSFNDLEVEVASDVAITLGGFLAIGDEMVLSKGTYSNPKRTVLKGREYALVPVTERKEGGQIVAGIETPCGRRWENYIAVDVLTNDILAKPISMVPSCGTKPDFWQFSDKLKAIGSGAPMVRRLSPLQVQQQLASQRARAEQDERSRLAVMEFQAQADRREKDRTRPLKKQIGASICKKTDSVTFHGYTERVSPDNGRIQVRVSFAEWSPGSRVSNFKEEILWDDPDYWSLCGP